MSPSRHRICCTCARCLTICPSGVWRPRAAMTSHLRRVQYETQPRRSVTPDRAIASTSQIRESVYTVLRRVLTMSFRCQLWESTSIANPSGTCLLPRLWYKLHICLTSEPWNTTPDRCNRSYSPGRRGPWRRCQHREPELTLIRPYSKWRRSRH